MNILVIQNDPIVPVGQLSAFLGGHEVVRAWEDPQRLQDLAAAPLPDALIPVSYTHLMCIRDSTNPIGGLAAFAGLTAGNAPAAVRSQAWKTGMYVFAILTVFAVSGSLIMRFFGFDLPSLQIAGGLVVAHSGFSMLENKRRATHEEAQHATSKPDVSFSPMALPLIAGPG